jgi:predicted GIY-YIG superfamily endonuclease
MKEVKTMATRDTHKYHLKQGNKIIRSGITNDLNRREREHQQEYGNNVHITKVGNATTREGARDWEKNQKRGTP